MNFNRINQARDGSDGTSGTEALPGARRAGAGGTAFTLLELMVVIAIIAIITGLGLPAIQKLAKPKGLSMASRQLKDDLALARSLALSSRAPVYVLFVPLNDTNNFSTNHYASTNWTMVNELVAGQYMAYALYSKRSVGEQPGREHPRYLTEWKTLPDNTFIPWYEFQNPGGYTFRFTNDFYFPTIDCTNRPFLYYLAFGPDGGLVSGVNAQICLAQGSTFNPKDPNTGAFIVANYGNDERLETPQQVPAGEIVPGSLYQVGAPIGGAGTVMYNSTTYQIGQTFTGVPGQLGYTVTPSLPNPGPFVKRYEPVEVNYVTGRGKIVRAELQ